MRIRPSVLLLCFVLLAAIGVACKAKSEGDAQSTTIDISGTVRSSDGVANPATLANSQVAVTVDRNADGSFDASERTTTLSGPSGAFSLVVTVADGDQVLFTATAADHATVYRIVRASPGATYAFDPTLRELAALSCAGTGCAAADGSVAIDGLPSGTTGAAQALHPYTDAASFPGSYFDSAGNLLAVGVFAVIELRDASSAPLTQLASPATLTLEIPASMRFTVRDGGAAADLQVPFYAFDPLAGRWIADVTALLVNTSGTAVPAAELANVRDGSFGRVFARADVTHFSFWSASWPTQANACVQGTLLVNDGASTPTPTGTPTPTPGFFAFIEAESASVSSHGVTYVGISPLFTAAADGRFCLPVLRSEGTGEDHDGDGNPGVVHEFTIEGTYDGAEHNGGQRSSPYQAGTCPADGSVPDSPGAPTSPTPTPTPTPGFAPGSTGCEELGDVFLFPGPITSPTETPTPTPPPG